MRILQILPELRVGGVETGTVDFAKYLKEHGQHNVVVSNGGALVEEIEKNGIRHYTLPVHKKSFWVMLRCVKALRKIILEENIEIVHARSRVPAWVAFFACRGTAAQFIVTCHGYYSKQPFSAIMAWAKLTIVPSEVIGHHMIDDFRVPAETIRCIPRSVDLKKFTFNRAEAPGKTTPVIAIVGRLSPIKGHIYFLRAIAKVIRSNPYVRVWIIGDAPPKREAYRAELESMVRHLGLSEKVEFLGSRKDVPQLLSQVDVLVMASTVPESFGRVILEAQAAGAPVVATNVGGVVEIIDDEKTGLLVIPKDPDAMAAAILRILNDPKLARQMVEEAKKKIEANYTLEHMASQTIAVYEELLASQNILVMKMSALGDVILITAALRALRQKFPKAKIYCLIGQQWRHILQRCPYIDDMIVVDLNEKGWPEVWRLGRKLRGYKFDKVIDFQNNLRSHVYAFLSFPRESYGFKNRKAGFLLSHPVAAPNDNLPPVEHQFQILKMLGISYSPEMLLELWPAENDRLAAAKLLESEWIGEKTNVVGVNLSASERWPTKNWPPEYVAKLCDILAGWNIRVALTGTTRDQDAARFIQSKTKTKPANLTGKTDIMELAAVIKHCKVFVTPDSAPLHIAAAMRVPFVALFGPTSSKRHMPPAVAGVALEKGLACAPCYGTTCKIKTQACIRQIIPEEVAQQIKKLMEQ